MKNKLNIEFRERILITERVKQIVNLKTNIVLLGLKKGITFDFSIQFSGRKCAFAVIIALEAFYMRNWHFNVIPDFLYQRIFLFLFNFFFFLIFSFSSASSSSP